MTKSLRYEDDEATFEREQWTPDAEPEPENRLKTKEPRTNYP